MREIKFRAWFTSFDLETRKRKPGRMVYFDQIGYCDEYNHLDFELAEADHDKDGGDYGNLRASIDDFPSIMQFTGLRDKTGKEIYEGDVLLDDVGDTLEVRFGNLPMDKSGDCVCTYPAFYVKNYGQLGKVPFCECQQIGDWMEIIGNIHENPELLK